MTSSLKFKKVISELPQSLDKDTVYLVRTGEGFDMFVTDETGNVAFQINPNPVPLSENESFLTVSDGFGEFFLAVIG